MAGARSASPLRFSVDMTPNGGVSAFSFASPDELVYIADQEQDQAFELFAGALDAAHRPAPAPRPGQ